MAATPAVARFRIILWTLVVVAALAATALYFAQLSGWLKPTPIGVTGTPFALESTSGGTFTQADLKGTPSLVFFGYTNCPDVCPTTLSDIMVWRHDLALDISRLRTIFVTVDPDRDSKQVLTDYLSSQHPGAIGLVGNAAQTEAVKASFGVYSEKGPARADGFYPVNHTATVFLIGKNGEFEGTIDYGEDTKSAEAKIKRLISG